MKKVVTVSVAIMCAAALFAAPWSKKAKGPRTVRKEHPPNRRTRRTS